jgi:hypothetical protein
VFRGFSPGDRNDVFIFASLKVSNVKPNNQLIGFAGTMPNVATIFRIVVNRNPGRVLWRKRITVEKGSTDGTVPGDVGCSTARRHPDASLGVGGRICAGA